MPHRYFRRSRPASEPNESGTTSLLPESSHLVLCANTTHRRDGLLPNTSDVRRLMAVARWDWKRVSPDL